MSGFRVSGFRFRGAYLAFRAHVCFGQMLGKCRACLGLQPRCPLSTRLLSGRGFCHSSLQYMRVWEVTVMYVDPHCLGGCCGFPGSGVLQFLV